MPFGYHGRLLRVDLGQRTTSVLHIDDADVRKYLLGSGLAAKMLFDDLNPDLDPLAPESPLLFISGLFTGGPLPGTSKLTVCARSPLTGIWNEATVGGHWPAEFRRTGYDGIVFEGRADTPVYLVVTGDGVEFRDGAGLWGKDTYEVEASLRPSLGGKAKIAAIGPAGEKLVRIASIIFDPPISRVAARAGVGAVMGSKSLKAVVVEGDSANKLEFADPDGLKAQLKADLEGISKKTIGLREFGTSGGVVTVEAFGDLPIKNWQLGSWVDGAKKITGQTVQPEMLDKHYSCFACPIRCGKIYKVEDKNLYGHGPEYETLGMLGANVLVDDAGAIVEGNELCNRYGIDTISAGAGIGFAIEAFEKGLITAADAGGVELSWNASSMLHLVHLMGKAEGIGALLGQGVKRAAEELGGNSEEFAVHTKGLEYPAHDPRGHVSMALNYATAGRGACHLEGLTYFLDRGVKLPDFGYLEPPNPHSSADKPPIVYNLQNYLSVFNPLGMCKFLFLGGVGPTMIAQWLRPFCGWDIDMDGVIEAGERLFNLKRMYNCKLGISRKDDVLPPRLYAEAKPDGSAKDVLPDLGNMLYQYYRLRGWSADGIPTPQKLASLGLGSGTGSGSGSLTGEEI